jgi:cobalt-zinc-cadmium efflux system protein
VLLFISVALILYAGVKRLFYPATIESPEMIIYAIIGFIGNGISLWILHGNKDRHITHQALRAHIISDVVQSVGVIFVGFAILLTNWQILDPLCSFLIVVFLFRVSVRLFAKSLQSCRKKTYLG